MLEQPQEKVIQMEEEQYGYFKEETEMDNPETPKGYSVFVLKYDELVKFNNSGFFASHKAKLPGENS
jgi:hypothetical protein